FGVCWIGCAVCGGDRCGRMLGWVCVASRCRRYNSCSAQTVVQTANYPSIRTFCHLRPWPKKRAGTAPGGHRARKTRFARCCAAFFYGQFFLLPACRRACWGRGCGGWIVRQRSVLPTTI